MNTEKSDRLVTGFRARPASSRRKIAFGGVVPAPPEAVFPLLCPARECDWIRGWSCELVHTESGYAERGCVFRTPDDSLTGAAVWVVQTHEPPRLLEIVRVSEHVVGQLRIELRPDAAGTSLRWSWVYTGLDDAGNATVDALPPEISAHAVALEWLTHYLETGEAAAGSVSHPAAQ